MLTRRRPGVYGRGTWFWLYVRAVFVSLISSSFLPPLALFQAPRREQNLLQLIEHLGQGALDLQGFLDLVGGDIWILPVFDKARTLVVPDELDERFRVRFPVRRKPFEVLENRVDAGLREESYRVLGVFVEIGVEDSLIHEPRVVVEEYPAQVVELERREHVGVSLQRFRQSVPVTADCICPPRLDPRDDREPVTRGRLGKDRAVFPLFELVGLLRYHNCLWLDLHVDSPSLVKIQLNSTSKVVRRAYWRLLRLFNFLTEAISLSRDSDQSVRSYVESSEIEGGKF